MADPICRWRNPYVSTIVELVKALPHQEMYSDEFRTIIEERWPGFLHTPYQLACQVGLYYESEDGMYYPRFNHDIDENEARSYMERWITRYYVPNPYTKSMKTLQQPHPFLASIIRYVYEHPDETELHPILEAVFQEKIGNIDIISNVLNTYTDLIKVDALGNVELTVKAIDFMKQYIDRNDKKAFFDNFSESNNAIDNISKNLIFYGAPGTGKSHRIKEIIQEHGINEKEQVIRTTFHPDSDYSTFVGCYKPIMKKVPQTYVVEGKEKPVIDIATSQQSKKDEIVYDYTPQAFVQAYTKAWVNSGKPIILVIEEINRGNCAQIFGDIFQLLDRGDDGVSDYEIKPDNALEIYLKGYFVGKDDVPEDIRNGEIMKLPANLYIWATMNTSDQSLFPIDSAFKRRWEWKYLPINNHEDKNYKIEIGSTKYDWWGFLSKVNQVIGDTTSSEDKKLGYFFAKANTNGIVTAEQFVGKVLFYLWNDVFKNYGFDNQIFDKGDKKKFDFSEFFKQDGSPDTEMVNKFLGKLDETIDKENTFVEKPIDNKGQEEPSDTEV